MKLNPEKASFGRHETFPLRYGWLPKGFQAVQKDPHIFENADEATVRMGVGKNMVNSIRFWLRATGMMASKDYSLTQLGKKLLNDEKPKGWDPYLEDEATIWLLHWLLASNAELSTTWFWFFNSFHKPKFTAQEAQVALRDFVRGNVKSAVATTTLKNDVAVLLRMYVQSKGNTRTPLEDALDSPLSVLGLISQEPGGKSYMSQASPRHGLPEAVLAYAVIELFGYREVHALPLEELMSSRQGYAAPGAVFRLSESTLVGKLESLVEMLPGIFEIRETAGLHQLYQLDEVDPIRVLNAHYRSRPLESAA
ncbi:MAG TPA: DUF4007 domain-containing protein [Opitutae bacterium]|nr:DUF4007 domain-containing protein [Opitutae bacterium]